MKGRDWARLNCSMLDYMHLISGEYKMYGPTGWSSELFRQKLNAIEIRNYLAT